jgi:hypothetical protein
MFIPVTLQHLFRQGPKTDDVKSLIRIKAKIVRFRINHPYLEIA